MTPTSRFLRANSGCRVLSPDDAYVVAFSQLPTDCGELGTGTTYSVVMSYVLSMLTRESRVGLWVKLDDDHIALVDDWGDVFDELGCVVLPCSSDDQSIHNGFHHGPAIVVRITDAVHLERDVDSDERRTHVPVQSMAVAVLRPREDGTVFPGTDHLGASVW